MNTYIYYHNSDHFLLQYIPVYTCIGQALLVGRGGIITVAADTGRRGGCQADKIDRTY